MSKINIPTMALAFGLTSSLLAVSATATLAQQTKKTPVAKTATAVPAAQYECQKCRMRYSAAVAKKNHFTDPMDGGKLTLIKTEAASTQKMAPAFSKSAK